MLQYFKIYLSMLVVFFIVDMLWLGLVASSFYKKHLGFLMSTNINWYAAIFFYLLFIVGILVFVVIPGIKENSLPQILLRAALFGLITYATYDLTNLATLKDWPVVITLIDLVWGMVLTTVVGITGFFAGKLL
jgi:uncharacterized membrane protein